MTQKNHTEYWYNFVCYSIVGHYDVPKLVLQLIFETSSVVCVEHSPSMHGVVISRSTSGVR